MKKLILILAVGFGLTACDPSQNKNQNSDPNSHWATVPTAQSCLNNSYNPQNWNPYQQYGFSPYGSSYPGGGYNPYSNEGFCGCQMGTVPVCDGSYGMGCVANQQLQGYNYLAWGYSGQGDFSLRGYGSLGYYNDFSQPKNCYSSVAQTCRVGTYDCGGYGGCAQTTPGNPIGICVRN